MERFIGLDLGTTTLGIARSDELGIAHPLEEFCFEVGYYKKAKERVFKLAEENNIYQMVLGLPLQLNRKEGERCLSVRRFKEEIEKERPEIKIILFDESFSTIEARERLQELGYKEDKIKKVIDMYSAVVILEDFLRNNYGKETRK